MLAVTRLFSGSAAPSLFEEVDGRHYSGRLTCREQPGVNRAMQSCHAVPVVILTIHK